MKLGVSEEGNSIPILQVQTLKIRLLEGIVSMVMDMLILGVYGGRKQVCDLNLMADLNILMKGLRKKKNCYDNFCDF